MKATILFFLVFLPSSLPARQLSLLITDARVLATDSASAGRQRFTDAQIVQFLNDGMRQAVSLSWCLEKSIEFPLVVGTTYYSMSSDFLGFRRVTRDHMLLNEMTPAALDGRSQGWQSASGLPTYYFLDFSSASKMGVAPFPDDVSSTGTMRVSYFAQATDMSESTDQPFNGVVTLYPYHSALVYYASSRMVALDGRMDLAAYYLQQFVAYVEQLKLKAKARENYLPRAISAP